MRPAFVISLYSYINILTYPFLSQAVCYHRFFSSYRANLRCAWSFGRRIRLQKYWPRCTRHEAGHVDLRLCRNKWKPLVVGRVAICRDLRPTFFSHFSTFLKLHLIASHFRHRLQGDIETAARLLARAKSLRVFPLLRKHLPQGWMMEVAEVNCWLGYSWISLISVHVTWIRRSHGASFTRHFKRCSWFTTTSRSFGCCTSYTFGGSSVWFNHWNHGLRMLEVRLMGVAQTHQGRVPWHLPIWYGTHSISSSGRMLAVAVFEAVSWAASDQ